MTLRLPPSMQPAGKPEITMLSGGTRLHRVHQSCFTAVSFNPTAQPSALAGGRFDSLDGSYAYTYLGEDAEGAIAETFCRRLPLNGAARLVPRKKLKDRLLTVVEVSRDLPILALHGAHLNQVSAPLDLTKSPPRTYQRTRAWAHALRNWMPNIAGFKYRCRHDEDRFAYVLFDDQPPLAAERARGALQIVPEPAITLDSAEGEELVLKILRLHNASLS